LQDGLGVKLSLGAISSLEARVSDALVAPVAEAWESVHEADVKHTDGTSWLQAGALMCLWTIATTAVTLFKVLADGSKSTVAPLFQHRRGILVRDRAGALTFGAMEHRQICWAHLTRKFVYFSERAGPTATLGKERLDLTVLVFDYQHDYQAGKLSKDKYVEWMAPVRAHFEATLQGAVDAAIDRARGITNDSNRQVELCQPDGALAAAANTPIKPPATKVWVESTLRDLVQRDLVAHLFEALDQDATGCMGRPRVEVGVAKIVIVDAVLQHVVRGC